MVQKKLLVTAGLVMVLALVAVAQTEVRPDGGPQQRVVIMQAQPQMPGGPGPDYRVMVNSKPGPMGPDGPSRLPLMRLREYADQLRASSREAQELADRLRRQADELDQLLMRQMNRGPGPQNMGRLQPMPSGPGISEPQEMKKQIERLREEAARAKQEGRIGDSQRVWQEAERMEQQLRGQGPGPQGGFGKPMPPEVQDILRAAEQAEREGRMEDARKQREKAEIVARQWEQQQKGQGQQQMGPRGDERAAMKEKIGRLREESRKAKEQGRFEDAERMWKDADRLEQQLREQGPGPKGGFGKPMPPGVQDILRAAEQAEREGRMEDARKLREKAQDVARRLEEQRKGPGDGQIGPRGDQRQAMKEKIGRLREEAQRAKEQNRFEDADRVGKEADRLEQQLREPGQGPKQPGAQLKDDLKRTMEDIKAEIGKLWQAVNEMRSRPQEGRPI